MTVRWMNTIRQRHGNRDMKDPEQVSAQFLKLLDIAERQSHVIEQWHLAQALGPMAISCGKLNWKRS
jgi:hypothetical protein